MAFVRLTSAERTRAYRQRQKERMENDPEYAAEVRERRRQSDSKYKKTHRDEVNARMRDWHRQKVQTDLEYAERKREAGRQHFAKNRDQRLESHRLWYASADRSGYNLAWSRANRDKIAEIRRRREARKKGATQIEQFTRQQVWAKCEGICGICKAPANQDDWHVDHIIPLSRGGQHTLNNVQVSHPRCNLSKYNKLLTEVA